MNFLENFFGSVALITTIIGLVPQIYKAFKTKSTTDVSMIMLWNFLICSASWIVYGLFTKSTYVVWSNLFCFLTSFISILQKRHYDSKNENS